MTYEIFNGSFNGTEGMVGILKYDNYVTGNLFGVGVLFVFYFVILFILLQRNNTLKISFLFASALTLLPAFAFRTLNLINDFILIFLFGLLGISVIWAFAGRTGSG